MTIWETIISQAQGTSWLEVVATVFGLLSVWYSKQENILVYPTGIISVLIYAYITFQYNLYAETGINTYYFVMSVYGWYHWLDSGDSSNQIPISTLNRKETIVSFLLFLTSFLLIRFGLDFTDSDVPNWDAFTTSTAITGMWLMARKKIENWLAWIVTDIVAVPLYAYKGLLVTSLQFLVFTFLATWGYFEWRKRLQGQTAK